MVTSWSNVVIEFPVILCSPLAPVCMCRLWDIVQIMGCAVWNATTSIHVSREEEKDQLNVFRF